MLIANIIIKKKVHQKQTYKSLYVKYIVWIDGIFWSLWLAPNHDQPKNL